MGAAENGTLSLLGASGRSYSVDVYAEDAAAGVVRFNPNGIAGAASPTQFRVPESCVITDFSIATGTTAVGCVFNNNSATISGGVIRYADHLNTLANRPAMRLKLNGGDLLGANNM